MAANQRKGAALEIPFKLALGWFTLLVLASSARLDGYADSRRVQDSRFGPHNGPETACMYDWHG
jgi:hypothetical protein